MKRSSKVRGWNGLGSQCLDINEEQIERIYTRIEPILTFRTKENNRSTSFFLFKKRHDYDLFMVMLRLEAVLEDSTEAKW
ncbi:hypothetical protein VTN00DRAFT_6972 [Thermoascus crustaceus]|uniref:uncharacterized protein n=1 Tax=Thermoascus crustaceus TaxID=5088 RepID=UPI003742DAB3